jgi:hypothetical protein
MVRVVNARQQYERRTCCIAGCPSWSRRFPGEFMCAHHWRMVRPLLRRALRKAWRRLKDARRNGDDTAAAARRYYRAFEVERALWSHAKRSVIMREAGL